MRRFVRHPAGADFPAGTVMLFQQSTAPIGWIKETTHNNKALRIVTGAASSGGTNSFTDTLGSGAAVSSDGTVLLESHIPATAIVSGVLNTDFVGSSPLPISANSGGGNAHSHTLSVDIQHVDVIAARRA